MLMKDAQGSPLGFNVHIPPDIFTIHTTHFHSGLQCGIERLLALGRQLRAEGNALLDESDALRAKGLGLRAAADSLFAAPDEGGAP